MYASLQDSLTFWQKLKIVFCGSVTAVVLGPLFCMLAQQTHGPGIAAIHFICGLIGMNMARSVIDADGKVSLGRMLVQKLFGINGNGEKKTHKPGLDAPLS